MDLFLQMAQSLALPTSVQQFLGAIHVKLQARAPFRRLQQQVNFRIMAERFKMAHSLRRILNGFPVDHGAGAKFQGQVKALQRQPLQNLQLNLAHQLDMNLPQALVPNQPQLRVLLLQLPQLAQSDHRVAAWGQDRLIGQRRFQHRRS